MERVTGWGVGGIWKWRRCVNHSGFSWNMGHGRANKSSRLECAVKAYEKKLIGCWPSKSFRHNRVFRHKSYKKLKLLSEEVHIDDISEVEHNFFKDLLSRDITFECSHKNPPQMRERQNLISLTAPICFLLQHWLGYVIEMKFRKCIIFHVRGRCWRNWTAANEVMRLKGRNGKFHETSIEGSHI